MILWFVDRFGLQGDYHRIWLKLLKENDIPIGSVRVISLHKALNRTLLQRHGTRKAPTWVESEGPKLLKYVDDAVLVTKPQAVVLASPESLACLGLHPDFATLNALRGSVYWRSDVPHIVMLPMSAWNTLVSTKEIANANYGFETKENFAEGQQGKVSQQGATRGDETGLPRAGSRAHFPRITSGASGDAASDDIGKRTESPSQARHAVVAAENHDRSRNGHFRDDALESGSRNANSDDDVDSDDDELSNELADEDHDQFFYEPVLSPVGRFVLTADVQKLARILKDGKNSIGPRKPIHLNWGRK